jgi:hypothetical protein
MNLGNSNRRKITGDVSGKIIELFNNGLNYCEIAKEVGVDNTSISRFFIDNNIARIKNKIEFLDGNKAKCSKCNEIKSLDLFSKNQGKFLSYCRVCNEKRALNTRNSTLKRKFQCKLGNIKSSAKKKGTHFNLDLEYLEQLYNNQNGLCFYTDEEMFVDFGEGKKSNSLSVDKIIPELGYIKGNVVLCCNRINTMKCNATLDEMKKWMPDWHNRIQEFLNEN